MLEDTAKQRVVGRVAGIGGVARKARSNGAPGRRLHRGRLIPGKDVRGHALEEEEHALDEDVP